MRSLTRLCALSTAAACVCLALAPALAQKPHGDGERPKPAERLYPVMVNFKWGYIDRSGKFVIEQRFDSAEPFRDGVAHVIERGGRGYIDREGKSIWKPSR